MERQRGATFTAFVIGLLLLAALPSVEAQSGSGVGVSPATLRLDDPPLLRGGGKVATLEFQQHDHDLARVLLSVQSPPSGEGLDASSWITLDPPEGEVEVPRTDAFPVRLEVQVPQTAANDEYAARVNFRVTQACEADGGACVGVQSATSAMVRIVVDDVGEVKRIAVTGSAQVHSMEAGGSFQFSVPLHNTGNVDANPHVQLEIWDKHQEALVEERRFEDTLLRPGEEAVRTFIVDDLDLPLDQYWGRVIVFLDGQEVHTTGYRTFDVVAPGTLAQTAVLRTIRVDGDITAAKVGDLVRLVAVVDNTGSVPVVARFEGRVLVDGVLVDTLESSSVEVPIAAAGELEMFYRVAHEGQHVFQGKVHYGNKVTEERSLILAGVDSGLEVPAWLWFMAGALVPVALVGMFVLGRRRGAKAGRDPAGPRRGRKPAVASASKRARRQAPAGAHRRAAKKPAGASRGPGAPPMRRVR